MEDVMYALDKALQLKDIDCATYIKVHSPDSSIPLLILHTYINYIVV